MRYTGRTARPSHHKWYSLARWKRHRTNQLSKQPLCCMCADEGRVTAATIADHVTPHRGDEALFWNGKLQSLCKTHHDSTKKRQENGQGMGYDDEGKPLDPSHPWNR
ncbi:MAG: HNH endonuclease [Robiginitomaculum sp.]|nr:MAG: HNH endonuclease [Robiginitomaculum sp.]